MFSLMFLPKEKRFSKINIECSCLSPAQLVKVVRGREFLKRLNTTLFSMFLLELYFHKE